MTTEMDKPRGNPTFNPATHLQVSPHNCGGIFGRGIVPHLTTMSCCLACWSTSNESFVTPSFLEFLGGNPPRTCQFTITRYLRRLSSVCIWLEHKYIYIYNYIIYIYTGRVFQNPEPHQTSSSSAAAPSLSHPSALSHATPSEATTRNLGHAAGSNRQIHLYTTIPSSSSTWQWESPTIHLHPFVDDPAVRPIENAAFLWFSIIYSFPKVFHPSLLAKRNWREPTGEKKHEKTLNFPQHEIVLQDEAPPVLFARLIPLPLVILPINPNLNHKLWAST